MNTSRFEPHGEGLELVAQSSDYAQVRTVPPVSCPLTCCFAVVGRLRRPALLSQEAHRLLRDHSPGLHNKYLPHLLLRADVPLLEDSGMVAVGVTLPGTPDTVPLGRSPVSVALTSDGTVWHEVREPLVAGWKRGI
jgi:hypothetical protein